MKIIETDNFARDYPDEKFLNVPRMTKESAVAVAEAINSAFPCNHSRYWEVVEDDYQLQGGFEP